MNRFEIVSRHNPKVTQFDKYSPLTVGNGEFAFSADATGLQTFPELYEGGIPLCTQSQWGWHTIPADNECGKYTLDDLCYEELEAYGKKVPYPISGKGQGEIYDWLRQNPHRLHLGRIGFYIEDVNGNSADAADINNALQSIDLWSGVMNSSFEVFGQKVMTEVFCSAGDDVLYIKVASELLKSGNLGIVFTFPYGSSEKVSADWNSTDKHTTKIVEPDNGRMLIKRKLDNDIYYVEINLETQAQVSKQSRHEITISTDDEMLILSARFSKSSNGTALPYDEAKKRCDAHWEQYWTGGGMIDFGRCKDERAYEIERRMVLSLYLLKVQCSGKLPPQETGLTFNSWYGKFHLEMHWWHAVHFAYWDRPELLENSLWWYDSILERAQAVAKMQGYEGARWPKMTDYSGNESPSFIGPLLIWQQPHPIYYSELIYSVKPTRETLDTYKDIVEETAKFMASYAHYDEGNDRYVLGPVLIPAQENHKPQETINPAFELEYWYFGLSVANEWRERLGMERDKKWDKICEKLSPLPQKDGVYLAHENCPDTFERFNFDHPSMIGALGILPGAMADKKVMVDTMDKVFSKWNFGHVWGWDFPMMAMTCTRLNMPEKAIESLLYAAPKNEYLVNGHNKQGDKKDLPIYLPGNGGLLTALAMMAAGWKGCTEKNPGFPKDGNWDINWENMNPML